MIVKNNHHLEPYNTVSPVYWPTVSGFTSSLKECSEGKQGLSHHVDDKPWSSVQGAAFPALGEGCLKNLPVLEARRAIPAKTKNEVVDVCPALGFDVRTQW